jgi:hypothetical protein
LHFFDFIDPALIREYYERNLEGCYVKYSKNPLMLDVRKLSGNGLLFSEGVEYKHKKKIMSGDFSFDFLKSKIKAISLISQ